MQELNTFEGESNVVLPMEEPRSWYSSPWRRGLNSASNRRSFRIAMPLHMAIDILQKRDMFIFIVQSSGDVECSLNQLENPHQNVCWLNERRDIIQVSYVQSHKAHCKVVELSLNYHERLVRYAFRTPSRHTEDGRRLDEAEWIGKCHRYMEKWIDLIVSEKKRQMHAAEHMRPPWPLRSEVSDVWGMPMVMWLSRAPRERHPPPPPHPYYWPWWQWRQ